MDGLPSEFLETIELLDTYPHDWAVCGGWAIDLWLNRVTRKHKDLDITIPRSGQWLLREFLLSNGWTIKKVASGKLWKWETDEWLELPVHNIWCSHESVPEHYLEVLFSETDESHYRFRRQQEIRLPLVEAFLTSAQGIPMLAPEIVLLFKAKYHLDKPSSQTDFDLILPTLKDSQRTWLTDSIRTVYGDDHAWLNLLK